MNPLRLPDAQAEEDAIGSAEHRAATARSQILSVVTSRRRGAAAAPTPSWRSPPDRWGQVWARRTDAASVQPTAIESAIPFFIVLLHSGRTTYLRRLLAALVQINHVARHSRAIEPVISNPG